MTIIIEPSWMTVPVMAALVVGVLSLVCTVLVVAWAVWVNCFPRARRSRLQGLELYGGF